MKRSYLKKGNTVNIATLKAKLALYLRIVKGGEEVLILDHKMPVARIVPIEDFSKPLPSMKPKADFSGFMSIKIRPLEKKPKVDIMTLLLEDRVKR